MKRTLLAWDRERFKRAVRARGLTSRVLGLAIGLKDDVMSRISNGLLPSEMVRNQIACMLDIDVNQLWVPVAITDDAEARNVG